MTSRFRTSGPTAPIPTEPSSTINSKYSSVVIARRRERSRLVVTCERRLLLSKANFTDDYVELSSCYVYTIDGLDMFVVVKKQYSGGECSTCLSVYIR